MSEDSLTLAEIQQACGVREEMEARVVQGLARFQRAIEQREVQVALFVVLELQEVTIEMQKEAYTWIGVGKKQD